MAFSSPDEYAEFERLHSLFQSKCAEELQLLQQLTQAKLDTQQLRLRLAAAGIQDATLIPQTLRCGGHREDTSTAEIRSLIEWLRDQCVFQTPTVFEVGAVVTVGSHDAFLGRMVSWPLKDGELKLSVPDSLEGQIKALTKPGPLDPNVLRDFVQHWEMIGAEVAAEGANRPAIFLIHRETKDAVVVGEWPVAQPVVKAAFDPDEYFKSLSEATEIASESAGLAESGSPMKPQLLSACKDDFTAVSDQPRRSITKSRSAGHLH